MKPCCTFLTAVLLVFAAGAPAAKAYSDAINVNLGSTGGVYNVSGSISTPQYRAAGWNNVSTPDFPDAKGWETDGRWVGTPLTANGSGVGSFKLGFYAEDFFASSGGGVSMGGADYTLNRWGWEGNSGTGGTDLYGRFIPFENYDVFYLTAGGWQSGGSHTGASFDLKITGSGGSIRVAAVQVLSNDPPITTTSTTTIPGATTTSVEPTTTTTVTTTTTTTTTAPKTRIVYDQTGILDNDIPRDAFYGTDETTWRSDQPGGLPYAGNLAALFTPYPTTSPNNTVDAIGAANASSYPGPSPFLWDDQFTVEAWVKPDPENRTTTGRFFSSRSWHVGMTENQGGKNYPHLITSVDWVGTVGVSTGEWHMVNVVYKRLDAGNSQVDFYLDGQHTETLTKSATINIFDPSYNRFGIGHTVSTTLGQYNNPYFGYIDELALFHSVLTPAQIQAHYDARNGNYGAAVLADEPGGYWNFNAKRLPGKRATGLSFIVR